MAGLGLTASFSALGSGSRRRAGGAGAAVEQGDFRHGAGGPGGPGQVGVQAPGLDFQGGSPGQGLAHSAQSL